MCTFDELKTALKNGNLVVLCRLKESGKIAILGSVSPENSSIKFSEDIIVVQQIKKPVIITNE